jgi:hypothetical protein
MDLQPPEALHGPTVTLRRYRLDDAPAIRDAIASEAARLLTNAALSIPAITRVEIHCDAEAPV